MKSPSTLGALAAPALRVASRLVNAVRLAGRPSHRRNVNRARRVLQTVRGFRGESAAGRAFAYLRRVDPYTFEEIVMTSLEDAGHLVLRSRSYSGDGGIDGVVMCYSALTSKVAVQVKRYDSTIRPQHVGDFLGAVLAGGFSGGLFIHCGRTSPLAKIAADGTPVTIVGGSAFLNLVLRRRLPTERTSHREHEPVNAGPQRSPLSFPVHHSQP